MTISVVNNGTHQDYTGNSVPSRAVSFTGVTAGNLLVVRTYHYGGVFSSLTDNVDGATGWNLVTGFPATTQNSGKFRYYWKKVVTSGNYTITLAFSPGNDGTYTDLTCHEFQSTGGEFSASPYAGSSINTQTGQASGTNVVTSGNVTPSGAPGFIVGSLDEGGTGGTITAGTGLTAIGNGGATPRMGAWKAFSDTSAVAVTFTTTASFDGTTAAVAFLEPGGGGGGTLLTRGVKTLTGGMQALNGGTA